MVNPYAQKSYTALHKQVSGQKRDQLQISAEAKSMLEERQTLSKAEREQVDRIKTALENGSYQVDSKQVAEKLYQFWFEKF